jgi:hypothetical protein
MQRRPTSLLLGLQLDISERKSSVCSTCILRWML